MGVLPIDIGAAIGGIGKIIDEFKVTDEERATAKAKLLQVEADLTGKVLEYEATLANAQRDVIVAEMQSGSVLARNWRPVLMVVITTILAHQYLLFPYLSKWFDVPSILLPDPLFTLLTIGVGGYVVGRSGEKIATSLRGTEAVNAVLGSEERQERKAKKQRDKMILKLTKQAAKEDWTQEHLQAIIDRL